MISYNEYYLTASAYSYNLLILHSGSVTFVLITPYLYYRLHDKCLKTLKLGLKYNVFHDNIICSKSQSGQNYLPTCITLFHT